jgi:hypothetical protein
VEPFDPEPEVDALGPDLEALDEQPQDARLLGAHRVSQKLDAVGLDINR